MGKRKLQPLRKHPIQPSANGTSSSSEGSMKKSQKSKEQESSSSKRGGDAESDEWERIEKDNDDTNSDSDDDGDDDDESDDINLEGDIVMNDEFKYTFEFNDMKDEYTESVTTLLRGYISNPTNAYEVATMITSQDEVGTVVCCEEADDAFAIVTLMPFAKAYNSPIGKYINSLKVGIGNILARSDCSTLRLFEKCLIPGDETGTKNNAGTTRTGVMIHRRFCNLPIQLIGALHRNFEEDITWIRSSESKDSDAEPATRKSFIAMKYMLLFCQCTLGEDSKVALLSQLVKNKGAVSILGSASAILFESFEEDMYFQHAEAAIVFRPAVSFCPTEFLAGLLVPVAKLKECVEGISEMCPSD